MKIGFYVQGDMDEAVVRGLKERWCPAAELAPGRYRGGSKESHRREIAKNLQVLNSHEGCNILVVLTDADNNPWREVKNREGARIPENLRHLTVFGVADQNIEWWLAIDRGSLARELECKEEEIPRDNPSDFVKRRFGLTGRDKELGKARVCNYVSTTSLRSWIAGSGSFKDFYEQARRWAAQNSCSIPNEWESE